MPGTKTTLDPNALQNRDGVNIAHFMKFNAVIEATARKFDRASKAHFEAAHLPWDGTLRGHKFRQGLIDSSRETERVASLELGEAIKRAGFTPSRELTRRIFRILDAADKKAEKSQKTREMLRSGDFDPLNRTTASISR